MTTELQNPPLKAALTAKASYLADLDLSSPSFDLQLPESSVTNRTLEGARDRFSSLNGKGAFVFKLGGSVTGNEIENVSDPELQKTWTQLAEELIFLLEATGGKDPIVVVHGGGKAIDAELGRRGITPVKIDGRRQTDHETMEVVEEVLSRQINQALVQVINDVAGRDVAVGIAGSSVISAEKCLFNGKDLGFVGAVREVDAEKILSHTATGKIVVLSPTGRSSETSAEQPLLNINGDDAAGAVARAIHQAVGVQSFIAATDVAGVLDGDKKNVPIITHRQAEQLKAAGIVVNGMIPKLEAGFELADCGIKNVRFVNGTTPTAIALSVLPECPYGTKILGRSR